jgi:hypothetical protein
MRFYRASEDWVTHLDGDHRAEFMATLRSLDLAALQKYPPPKLNGLPFGNEGRIFARFVRGKSSQLDASALSGIYRSFMSPRERLVYRAFRMNDPLSRDEWAELIGNANIDKWIAYKFLQEKPERLLGCAFSLVGIDGLIFAVDPLLDHGVHWEPDFLVDECSSDPNIQTFHHTYIGLDSLQMIEAMERAGVSGGGRYLDCGPGSGSVLLYFARRFQEAFGIDINERAVKLAGFNAAFNGLEHCRAVRYDALNLGDRYGKFDLVSWNLPFIFMPEDHRELFIDAFGGEMGIGLCLRFIETLPELISEDGRACVAAMAPILDSGTNVLEERLRGLLAKSKLDCCIQVAQAGFAHTRELWDFHRSHEIRKFESVYMHLKHGDGRIERTEPPIARRMIDIIREKMYARKFS